MIAIRTKYLGYTQTKPSRIKAWAEGKRSVTLPYEHDGTTDDAHDKAAIALCRKLGWTNRYLARGGDENGNVYVMLCGLKVERPTFELIWVDE